jgi:phage head maturation protease
VEDDARIEVRDKSERILRMRIVPWEKPVISRAGPEVVMRGAFDGVDESKVVLRLEHENPPAGKGIPGSYSNEADGAYMEFRASKTQRGDDILTLADDGITSGVSVGYEDAPDGIQHYRHAGKSLRVVHKAFLREVSTTWRPTWKEAEVLSVRSSEGEPAMTDPVADATPAPVAPAVDITPVTLALEKMAGGFTAMTERLEKIEERSRQEIVIPSRPTDAPKVTHGQWMEVVVKMLSGERVPEMQLRTLDEIITTDNVGVVPDAVLSEIVGIIDTRRPFLASTRRLELPPAGMTITVPVIETRPETGVQAEEKDDIASNQTEITTDSFDAVTIAGGGDLSLQLLKRSSPSFLGLYLELLTESLNKNMEIKALQALYLGDTPGGTLDPDDASFGQAWKHGAAVGVPPDTLWLSSTGVAQFIDAKADGTNAPLYSSIQAGFTAGNGPAGTISGLRPVYVPAMDVVGDVDAIVGPSRGFAWTEDGTYTLQVDVPAKAGRDVALVTIAWFMPLYPSAFTTYQIAS